MVGGSRPELYSKNTTTGQSFEKASDMRWPYLLASTQIQINFVISRSIGPSKVTMLQYARAGYKMRQNPEIIILLGTARLYENEDFNNVLGFNHRQAFNERHHIKLNLNNVLYLILSTYTISHSLIDF